MMKDRILVDFERLLLFFDFLTGWEICKILCIIKCGNRSLVLDSVVGMRKIDVEWIVWEHSW